MIIGIEKLTCLIYDPTELEKLETGVKLHKRHSRITFEVLACTTDMLHVRVRQGQHPQARYFSALRLAEIGNELFAQFISANVQLRIEARPYGDTNYPL